jgi:predicted transcriptional regulator
VQRRKFDDNHLLALLKDGNNQKEAAKLLGVSPAAITKRLKRLVPLPESLQKLTPKEQKFAVAIAHGRTKTQACLETFEVTSRESAKALGTNLMKKADIREAIADLMDQKGLTQEYRVEKLKSHVDNADPNISLKALDQSWKLDGSYAPERHLNLNAGIAAADYRLFKNYRSDEDLLLAFPEVEGQCDMCGNPTYLEFCEECQEKYFYLIAKVIKARVGIRSFQINGGKGGERREEGN